MTYTSLKFNEKRIPKKCLHPSASHMGYVDCNHSIKLGEIFFCGFKGKGCNYIYQHNK